MRYIADLHVHSHYSRATSKDLNLESLYQWAQIKGINVVGTGDFTHPEWFAELREKLEPDGNGFFILKDPPKTPGLPGVKTKDIDVRFCLTTEISSIYKHGDRIRKNHNLVYAPNLDTVARINHKLSTIGNLEADGRPILGLPSRDLLEIVLETSDRAYLIPAHIWTPWFSTLGSKAGYDSIDACFRDLTDYLFAVETGLSSDPVMNWKLSALDRFTLISNSDAHSPSKLGREANVLDTKLSYDGMFNAFKTGEGMMGTYEFHPEEGKYHHDGHRKCDIHMKPEETNRHDGLCPVCGKPLTVGVLNRVESLADRNQSEQPNGAAGYDYIIPLPEVIGEIEGYGPKSKTVQEQFQRVISTFGNEFTLLRQTPIKDIEKSGRPVLAEAVRRIREDEVDPKGGYDGVFGVINIFKDGEIERIRGQLGFFGLDEYKVEKESQVTDTKTGFGVVEKQEVEEREVEAQEESTLFGLNAEQQRVRQALTGATLVKAGPGTGKTHTLIEWLVHQVKSGNANPHELLAVTFTNKAADELDERLHNKIGTQAESVTIGTFHALAWRWIKQYHPDLNTIYDTTDRRMMLHILYPDLKSSEISNISDLISGNLEFNDPIPEPYLNHVTEYRNYAWEQGSVDLSDLIRRTIEALQTNDAWLGQLRERYKAIAVDEFQDINPLQYQLVELLGKGQNILAIGDPDQAIYGFRGSDVELFFDFTDNFNAREITLIQNYRSTDTILKAAGSVIRNNSVSSDVPLKSQKETSQPIEVFQAQNPFEEADYILDQIKKYVGGTDSLTTGAHTDSNYDYGFEDIAILFRTHSIGKSLIKSFLKAGIPMHLGDGTAFLSEPPFTVISDLLHLYLEPQNAIHLSHLLVEAYGWEKQETKDLLSLLEKGNQTLFGDASLDTLSQDHLDDMEDLKKTYQQIVKALNDGNIASGIEIGCDHYLPDEELNETDLLKKETLLELAEESDGNIETFIEQMQLNPYTDAGRLKTEGIHLLTFHAAKGLEFPVVFIAGAEEGITPLCREGIDMEEERRLFYVALTRAEDILHISGAGERAHYGTIEETNASRFIEEIPSQWKWSTRDDEAEDSHTRSLEEERQLGLF